ncbi:glycosyltransferase [Hymenobacter koreensis]|uniref:Glycosyltransferase family 4 protein n=1 Tax=Hymenobacter koreensis TaxID=1084523 RepID=A0ABP8J0J8_9BACT
MTLPRVLMLPKWYPNRYDDQDGDFVQRHVAAIAPHAQVAVLFATVARGPLPRLAVYDADWQAAVPTLRYYYRARPTGVAPLDKLLKLLLYFGCVAHGYTRLRRRWGRPQLVHVHVLLRTGVAAWLLKLLQGIPYVVTEHWTLYLPPNAHRIGWLRHRLTAFIVRQAHALHTVSADLAAALNRLGATNPTTAIIPNVVDTELFRPASTVPQQGYRLLNVAAFNEAAKNLSGLLRVVARLRLRFPQLTLRVAGYGPDEARLRELAQELGVLSNGTIQFLGKLNHAAVAAEMQQADAFVLFSNYENLPCVLIEAQASGLPAVATRVGGVPELLPGHDGRGRLVPPGNEAALEQALEELLSQPRPLPAQLREQAVARFGVVAVGRQFAAMYTGILGGSVSALH